MRIHPIIGTIAALAVLALQACAGVRGPGTLTPEPSEALSGELLEDVEFAHLDSKVATRDPWSLFQHAGEPSFTLSVSNGVMRLEKTGPSPWAVVKQTIDARQLVGKTLRFSVEIAGHFQSEDEYKPFLNTTRLTVLNKGLTPGTPRILGAATLSRVTDELPRFFGEQNWQRRAITFTVPKGTRTITVVLRLGEDGVLKARNPSLVVVGRPD